MRYEPVLRLPALALAPVMASLMALVLARPGEAGASGLTAQQLQTQLAAASNSGQTSVNPQGGNVSATVVLVKGATVGRSLSSRASEHISVGDFAYADSGSRIGGVIAAPLAASAAAGSILVGVPGSLPIAAGSIVLGPGVAAGTVVMGTPDYDPSRNVTNVTLSLPTTAAAGAGAGYDFATQDDRPAFLAALASGAMSIEVPPGRYYLSGYVGAQPGTMWLTEGASFARGGGIAEGVDQSLEQSPVAPGLALYRQFTSTYGGEQSLLLGAMNTDVGSTVSDQKSVEHIVGLQAARSTYSFLGDPVLAVHDLVGSSTQVSCAAGNTRCSLFGQDMVLNLNAGTDGPAVGEEMRITNNRANAVLEGDSWNNVSAVDYIAAGVSPLLTGLTFQGTTVAGTPGFSNAILVRQGSVAGAVLAVRQDLPVGSNGISPGHSDVLRLDANGGALLQTLHVGGGATTNDTYPASGLSIDQAGNVTAQAITVNSLVAAGVSMTGDSNGALSLGNPNASVTPYIDFVSGGGSDCRLINSAANNLAVICGGQTDVIYYGGGANYIGRLDAQTASASENSTKVATTAWVRAFAGQKPITGAGGNYTLSAADCGNLIRDTAGAAHTYTIPASMPVGCSVDVLQAGAGAITFSTGSGVTLEGFGGAAGTAGQFARANVLIDSGSTALLSGQIK